MNYGKKSILKKRKALTSRASMMGKRASVTSLRILFLSLITLCLMLVCLGVGSFKGIIDNAPKASEVNITPLGSATFVYDDQGNKIQKLTAPDSNRLPVSIDQIPEDMQHAFVAIEDERFYEHNGIDVRGILRAGFKALSTGNFSEGASTITQQLLKNNVFTSWTEESTQVERFKRKFQEQYLAIQVEKEIRDKNVILENYLNTINLGAGAYGVQAAAHRYFNKDVWELNLSESATIAGITQNPTKYNPITNPSDNATRRKKVLNNMLEQEYITQAEYDEAMNDDVYSRIQETETDSGETSVYSYFIDEMTDQVINDLQTLKGYSEKDAYNKLYSGGLQIYTTQDPNIQNIVDEEYNNPENFPEGVEYYLDYALTVKNSEGEEVNYSKEMLTLYFKNQDPSFDLLFSSPEEGQTYVDQYKASILAEGNEVIAERVSFTPQPQSSMTIMDQSTGYVKAIMGGRGEKTASLTLNRATDTKRQPGSTFKIPSTYAPALDAKNMSLATIYKDEPFKYSNGAPLKNSDNTYHGDTTIRYAIQQSINIVAVKCMIDVTPQLAYEYLQNFGFTTIVNNEVQENGDVYSDLNESMPLGALTYGVKNIELNAAYAAIANGGKYIKPVYYTKILDADGNVLIDNQPASKTVIKESTAWLLTSAMEDVVNYGTGTMLQLDNIPVAGKTGTTDAYNDLWFSGFTPYYTCTVWSGYDNNEKLPDSYMYRNFHKILWKKVMSRIHQDLPYKEFQCPTTVEKATVCSNTLMLPNYGCPTVSEYFDVANLPTERCNGDHGYDDYDYDDEEDEDEGEEPTSTPTATPEIDENDNGPDDTDDNNNDYGDNDWDDYDDSGDDDKDTDERPDGPS